MSTSRRPLALVTGASSGIGAEFARQLARRGYDLLLVARRADRLDALASDLAAHGAQAQTMACDLTRREDRRDIESLLAREPVALLVNNAGFGAYMPFVDLDPDVAEEQIALQSVAVARLSRAALPGMIGRGSGTIINVSSRLAWSGPASGPTLPKRANYAATKAYVNTFTQILAQELEGTGVRVQALCPGVVFTEFHMRQGIDPKRFPPEIVMPAEDVVRASLEALDRGEVFCVPALDDVQHLATIDESHRALLQHSALVKRRE